MTDEQVGMLQRTIRDSGALDELERVIERNTRVAREAIADAPLSRSAKEQLRTLADSAIRRTA